MTDDLLPEHEPSAEAALASASVDGVLSADEQAQVDASPEVQALARTFTVLRAGLADTSDLAFTARDSAIAAALTEFDALQALPAAAAVSAPVIDLASRRRWPARVMAAAAAVVLLGVAGVAVFGGNHDSKSDSGTAARTQSGAVVGGAPQSTIGAINAAADPRLSITDPQQLRDLQPVPAPEIAATDANGSAVAATTPGAPQAKDSAVPCLGPHQIFLAQIFYAGTPAIAARDTVTGVTQAIDEQCHVLVEVAP